MYQVELYLRVRRACMVDGMSTREASRVFGLHRDTVRKMLAYSVPPGYRRRQPPRRPRIGPYTGVIDRILEDDLGLPRKQGSTSSSWTCPTAMPCSSGHTPPRPPRRSATDMCRRSRSLEEFHRASCTTTPVCQLRGYWETVVADAHACSQSCSRTTCPPP